MDIMPPGSALESRVNEGNGDGDESRQGDRGHTGHFLCPYHSWTFDLDSKSS